MLDEFHIFIDFQFRECREARKELCYPYGCIGLNVYATAPHRLDTLEAGKKCQALIANLSTLSMNILEIFIVAESLESLRCAVVGNPQR